MELEDEITPDNSPQHSAFGGEDTESEAEDDSSTSGPMKPKGKAEFQTGNKRWCYYQFKIHGK